MSLDLNPKFTFFSPIRTSELGGAQLADHVDHAIIALDGRAPAGGHCSLELLQPLGEGPATLRSPRPYGTWPFSLVTRNPYVQV